MPRSMSEKYESAHRVVVMKYWMLDGARQIATNYYGPYAKAGTAKAILAKELRWYQRYSDPGSFDGWIEKSSARWERVE